MIRSFQLRAETELINTRPDIAENIMAQQKINARMKQGDVEKAIQIQNENREKQKLLNYGGSQ